ncbi:MAG: ribonucleotide-diphosphate reductase subunit alpha [Candidatus Methanofastidiosum methylothiophilum]|uniref:Vitamin B12-dependent ribonucleotide reductase n=1 Tax=Candidatus Methanofastidiosum methylothiophilum TaxID=1705564 RepID=A0A150ITT5_9EURY|nr:MAG: ribonucleotide-diphosphate reductase subunit alpha [Candidatus Methanofastidiosum methylthiophilus]KYC48064.1 MAG: ribonucleotide-diphosphate reductase subunit alpha [Candidatus Methanofastidiosum methylthiophilus]KYC50455.1 MAG: ribonucleotide-diphosphate reductase subunit alpha [Candidatus Methanofastidiosum methylthiophilus]
MAISEGFNYDKIGDTDYAEEPLNLSDNAVKVLERRYLKKDQEGNVVETPNDLFLRVAKSIAIADFLYDGNADVEGLTKDFYEMMTKFEFLPNSPTLMNAGRELGQLSACFVLPVEDSIDSIFDAIKYTALIHKSGGGTGFSFSRLRPKNDVVLTTKGISSGPVSFMTVFDTATETIKQGGTRRGANMAILRVDHPDILEFIKCKEENTKLNNFNISVAITDKFIEAFENGKDYELINPRNGKVEGKLNAKEVFNLIVKMAWKNGEPGIVFIDRINRGNPTPAIGEIESTNPCGEQPLLPYESCNLGSINLSKFLKKINKGYEIDFDHLRYVVKKSVHFLDNVIDVNRYPLAQIEDMTKGNRKIGLGVMGFADMLLKLGIPYNSEDAVDLAKNIMKFIKEEAIEASRELASKRGPFPNFENSIFHERKEPPVRNATVTTIAPTGTISLIAGSSSGIEPIFAISYIRNVMDKDELLEINPVFAQISKERGIFSQELMKKIAREGTLKNIDEIPEDLKKLFVTAHDITPEWHIRIQSAFQEYTDNAVSKTINFPKSATEKDVMQAYLLAYRSGLKGTTIYRDGSRDEQVLNIGKVNKKETSIQKAPRPRPKVTKGFTEKIRTGCGNLYVTINEDEYGLCEIFMQMGKSGGCPASQNEAIARLISLALRSGIRIESILEQLRHIRCPMPTWDEGMPVHSCADAIAIVLDRYIKNELNTKQERLDMVVTSNGGSNNNGMPAQCPECGEVLVFSEGCVSCKCCGYTKC